MGSATPDNTVGTSTPWIPPRWFELAAWRIQRLQYRALRGRTVLRAPERGGKAGRLQLRTTGRRTGRERAVVLCYWLDSGRYVTLAMNGWQPEPPAWWLNLEAHPDAVVQTVDGEVAVRGRAASGAERERLWAAFADYHGWGEGIDRYAAQRPRETPVVVLEPR